MFKKIYLSFQLIVFCTTCIIAGCEYNPVSGHQLGIDSGLVSGASLLWKSARISKSAIITQPIRTHDTIYFFDAGGVICVDAKTGNHLWQNNEFTISSASSENAILFDNKIIVVDAYSIISVDAKSGRTLWSISPPSDVFTFDDVYYNSNAQSPDALFVTAHNGDILFKISKNTGAILWRSSGALLTDSLYQITTIRHGGWNGIPAYSNGKVYVSGRYGTSQFWAEGMDHDGSVACFDANDGKLLWCKVIPVMDKKYSPYQSNDATKTDFFTNVAPANIIVINDTLMVKTGNAMTWMDKNGNIIWRSAKPDKHGLSETPSQIRYWQNRLLVLDYDGKMPQCYGMDPVTHNFLWTTVMSENSSNYHSYVLCPPPSYVGNIIYFISDDDRVIGIDVTTGKRTYTVDASALITDPKNPNQVFDNGFYVDQERHLYVMDNQYIYCFQMNQ